MENSVFIGTAWSLLPPVIAIVLAFITKEVYSALFVGIISGALLYGQFNPWISFESIFTVMTENIDLNILIFLVMLGMIVILMQKSGGSAAYARWAATKIKNRKMALLATTFLGMVIFVDDYFNCLTVGSVMRPVTDKYKVSRAKLAYIIDSTAAPVCIIAPISSWAAAVNSYVPEDAGINGLQLFISTIPYNLYALLTLLMVIYTSARAIDFGTMKIHEDNAINNNDLFTDHQDESQPVEEIKENPNGRVYDLLVPTLMLIVSAVCAMMYTGFSSGATNIQEAFADCDSEISLIFATFITVLFLFFFYIPRKIVSFTEFMQSFVQGFQLMIPAIAILTFAWTLKGMTQALGIGDYVSGVVGNASYGLNFVPVIMFVIAIFIAFSTGTSWGTFAILVPIVTSIFGAESLQMMIISVSAVLAGSVCGDHISPISDTTIMSSAGAQCYHMNHVSTQMQYAVIPFICCMAGYIVSGFTRNWVISLVAGAIIMVVSLELMKRRGNTTA
ncbi:MAG: Na+/H+ antiporter NhaC family protein [Lachnospiraceae bacterium]|nr:Na+/H+ antiporter NhaC family protein [Lachnospiraceae bacterium]